MLLCAPSMGVLDNWLPVLHAARAAHPDWRIVALIPDRETLAQIDPTDTAHVLADEVIDATVAPLVDGGFIEVPGLLAAVDAARPAPVASLVQHAAGAIGTERMGPLLRALRTRRQRVAAAHPADWDRRSTRLLCDPMVHDKPRFAGLLGALAATPRHTMLHGIAILKLDGSQNPVPGPDDERAAYLFSRAELPAYRDGYGIPGDRLHVVGIARHETSWVDRVVERSRTLHRLPFERAVLLVSRPAGSAFLPHDRKIRLLRALHTVAKEELGLPLVIRVHPKERSDGTFDEALPPGEEGRTWAFSRAHPFHLAQHAEFGVVFLSGVSVDLVALGVPVIQLLEVETLPELDDPRVFLDAARKRRFGPYVHDGLVHAADGQDELRDLISRGRSLVEPLRARYSALFEHASGAADRIVATIAADLAGSHLPGD